MKLNYYGKGLAKGLKITLRQALLRHRMATQYPDERINVSRRFRGCEFVWDEGLCTGCATCAKSCPQGNIEIVTSSGEDSIKYKVEKFEIDTGRCIFCGLCVESCPYNALFFSMDYESAKYRRGELVLSKEQLKRNENKQISGYFRPEIEETLPEQTLMLDKAGRKTQELWH